MEQTEKAMLLEKKERDFLELFDKTVKQLNASHIIFKTIEICKIVANSVAPQFYVTTEQALFQYRQYKNGISDIRRLERRKMYATIFARFEELIEKYGEYSYQYSVMDEVLAQEAPCFYLNDSSAIRFYYTAMHHHRKRMNKRHL